MSKIIEDELCANCAGACAYHADGLCNDCRRESAHAELASLKQALKSYSEIMMNMYLAGQFADMSNAGVDFDNIVGDMRIKYEMRLTRLGAFNATTV